MTLGLLKKLFVSVLLGTTLIDKFIKSIHPAGRKIVASHSTSVPVQMLYKAKSEEEKNLSDIRQLMDLDPSLLVTPVRIEPKYIIAPDK